MLEKPEHYSKISNFLACRYGSTGKRFQFEFSREAFLENMQRYGSYPTKEIVPSKIFTDACKAHCTPGNFLLSAMVQDQFALMRDSSVTVKEMHYTQDCWALRIQTNFGERSVHKNWATVHEKGLELLKMDDEDDQKLAAMYAIIMKFRTIALPFSCIPDDSEPLEINGGLRAILIGIR